MLFNRTLERTDMRGNTSDAFNSSEIELIIFVCTVEEKYQRAVLFRIDGKCLNEIYRNANFRIVLSDHREVYRVNFTISCMMLFDFTS